MGFPIPILGDVINAVKDIVSEVVVDKDKRNELNYRLEELANEADKRTHEEVMGQLEINKVEAAHKSVIVAGWRPFIGWSGGVSLTYNTIIAPAFGLGQADLAFLQTILLAILGVGAMRSYDKKNNAATESFKPKKNLPKKEEATKETVPFSLPVKPSKEIAWGAKVSDTFKDRVRWIGNELGVNPDYLMACMAWESGETFSASVKNAAGSGATGLIQFMPSTARQLGTSTSALAEMTAEDQLNFVYKYFKPYKGRLNNLGDVYMAILWPKGVGKADNYVLWDRTGMPTTFRQNAGLDSNKDGVITRKECLKKIQEKLDKGRKYFSG